MNNEAKTDLAKMIAKDIVNGFYGKMKEQDIMEHILGEIEGVETICNLNTTSREVYPGDLPLCKDCMLNLRQCEMMTSTNRCKVWNDYEKSK